jgi:hypothetical protein
MSPAPPAKATSDASGARAAVRPDLPVRDYIRPDRPDSRVRDCIHQEYIHPGPEAHQDLD